MGSSISLDSRYKLVISPSVYTYGVYEDETSKNKHKHKQAPRTSKKHEHEYEEDEHSGSGSGSGSSDTESGSGSGSESRSRSDSGSYSGSESGSEDDRKNYIDLNTSTHVRRMLEQYASSKQLTDLVLEATHVDLEPLGYKKGTFLDFEILQTKLDETDIIIIGKWHYVHPKRSSSRRHQSSSSSSSSSSSHTRRYDNEHDAGGDESSDYKTEDSSISMSTIEGIVAETLSEFSDAEDFLLNKKLGMFVEISKSSVRLDEA